MEDEDHDHYVPVEAKNYYAARLMMSPEIVEIGEDSRSVASSREVGCCRDVYVAVGKDDLDVLKWALDNVVSSGSLVFLIHVFPPITYIPTPVGRLSRSQLSKDQVRVYINEENNRRRNMLMKYIKLCNDAKVAVDTVLLENNDTAKAILDLIPILNITILVMGTKRLYCLKRSLRKRLGKGETVKKSAPESCEVTIVYNGKKVEDGEKVTELVHNASLQTSSTGKSEFSRQSERNFFECSCFSGKFH
ncbi:hypothetical protein FEM48_Zijuj05G0069000 [Ziziphus jujuba var. spinosa]|uniref:UspA domain-containing protein n=1 Tax=Ziziphus jujuba var. spinosa TaxID=714518 RepID=A0A978VDG8_ZIZJJ|nr:hypothetical protein FEM48_Zijuj05G0069000 [Ziziphus jujuba var. spinosa]